MTGPIVDLRYNGLFRPRKLQLSGDIVLLAQVLQSNIMSPPREPEQVIKTVY